MRFFRILLPWLAAGALGAAEQPPDATLVSKHPAAATELVEGPLDSAIAKLTSQILEVSHYSRQPFDAEMGGKFLDRYLSALDFQRLYFLQSDLDEFDQFRPRLHDLTKRGKTYPARIIFTRFLERLEQQHDYFTNLLATGKFKFDTDERFLVNRKEAARPKDLAEARKLWHDRLRYEYLQEKLGIGKPDVIVRIIKEKLEQKKTKEIAAALKDKLSKERVEEIARLVGEKSGKESPAAIAQAVAARLDQGNADEIVRLITRRYTRTLKTLSAYDDDDVIQVYLSALTRVYDPHSDYLGKDELKNFSIGMNLSLFGIGAVLSSDLDGYTRIKELKPGPAMKSKKVKVEDKIIAVAQGDGSPVDVVDMKLRRVVELIRGPKDTEVRLTIIPNDATDSSERRVVKLIRDEIKLEDQEAKAKLFEFPDDKGQTQRLGVIDLPSFYAPFATPGQKTDGEQKITTTDVAKLLKKLKEEKVSGVVLDLRRNGGGSLEEAINLAGLFIKEGPVVQVRDYDGKVKVDEDTDPSVAYDGPLLVLTSRFSASASEIVAGALQDYGRAVVVGDASTHGKGTVQSVLQLVNYIRNVGTNDPGAVKVTIRKFYRASGESTQLEGVKPDVVLPSLYNHGDFGEAALENALKWDTIKSAKYDKLDLVAPYVAELRQRSQKRVAADSDFQWLAGEIERYKKALADKTVSLNEPERLKEKNDNEARAKTRKKALAARPEPSGKVYDLTLKLAGQSGLPAPTTRTNKVDLKKDDAQSPSDPGDGTDPEEPALDESAPKVDYALDEARRILMDLIALSSKKATVAVSGSGK